MKLIGPKVILRPLERRDLEQSRTWVNDPENADAVFTGSAGKRDRTGALV